MHETHRRAARDTIDQDVGEAREFGLADRRQSPHDKFLAADPTQEILSSKSWLAAYAAVGSGPPTVIELSCFTEYDPVLTALPSVIENSCATGYDVATSRQVVIVCVRVVPGRCGSVHVRVLCSLKSSNVVPA
jgi:hypothetical protein